MAFIAGKRADEIVTDISQQQVQQSTNQRTISNLFNLDLEFLPPTAIEVRFGQTTASLLDENGQMIDSVIPF